MLSSPFTIAKKLAPACSRASRSAQVSAPKISKVRKLGLFVIAAFFGSSPSIPFARNRFTCLPNGMKLSRTVGCDTTVQPWRETTLEETLVKMGTRCKGAKLVDAKGKEIRFYTVHGFGAPTAYAMETMRRQRMEIETLKRKYTVIEIPSRDKPCEAIP